MKIDIGELLKLAHYESVESVFNHVNENTPSSSGVIDDYDEFVDNIIRLATEEYSKELKRLFIEKTNKFL